MQLNESQLHAVENGKIVPIVINQTRCVVLREDLYDRVKGLLNEMDPREGYGAIVAAWDEQGSPEDEQAYKDL